MPYSIFFSHSGADHQWAQWIAQAARNSGIGVYLFEHDPQPGRPLAEKIKASINSSDALVVLLTLRSQFSAYVQQEIGYAEAQRKLIIPLVWTGAQKPALAMLEGREYVPFDPARPHVALNTLVTYLYKLRAKKEATQALLGVGALVIAAVALLGGQK
jgi:hypothetical protein